MTPNDKLDIAVRAYTESAKTDESDDGGGTGVPRIRNDEPSEWAVVFDTETTTDAAQSLRIGAYQVRHRRELHEGGLFFEPIAISKEELILLRAYTKARKLRLRTRWEFVHYVLFRYGWEFRGVIVGFNLPFDISRLAIGHTKARGSLRGGFSFKLSKNSHLPRVRVKSLNRRAALIDFNTPAGQGTPRGMRKRDLKIDTFPGFFVDVKTLAGALRAKSFTLASLCNALGVEHAKLETEEHGALLTETYLDYARRDVQATWECYLALKAEFDAHGLSVPPHRISSEASIGKAYLKDMGVRPLLDLHPDFPRALFGPDMCSYYGGRAEVRCRRTVKRVLYTDFKSMYPTVNALMGLWRFVIADGLSWRDGTAEVRAFLSAVTVEYLHKKAVWPRLTALVRVKPDGDLLPVRAKYDGRVYTIGLNHLTCGEGLWYTLADAVAAKLLSGKSPTIEEAIVFEPGPPQDGLRAIDLFGRPEFRVDPRHEDVFTRLIDLRDDARARNIEVEKAIKIVANATSYGIFVEVLRDEASKPEAVAVWGPDGERRDMTSTAIEQPGKFFNPAIATLITGAARLMLALAERRTLDEGLDWAFCDTDSLAIAKPDDMSEAEFEARWRRVVDWFEPLNPYRKPGSILQVEKHNYAPGTDELRPLYALAISAKRYVLFNRGDDGRPVIRKASAHGLGHLRAPYAADNAPADIPPPVDLADLGVERWEHDLWFKIIEAAHTDTPHVVPLDHHPALARPAVSRYGATSPELLAWFKSWNEGRPYTEQVRPFGFLLAFTGRNGLRGPFVAETLDARPGRGRPKKARPDLKPVAPFDRDHDKAIAGAFDRVTGAPISPDDLMTYAEALAGYHLSCESKFANAGAYDAGRTERRHVAARRLRMIGKEANRLDDDMPANELGDDVADYESGGQEFESLRARHSFQ